MNPLLASQINGPQTGQVIYDNAEPPWFLKRIKELEDKAANAEAKYKDALRQLVQEESLLDWVKKRKADVTECSGKWSCCSLKCVPIINQPDPRSAIIAAMRKDL